MAGLEPASAAYLALTEYKSAALPIELHSEVRNKMVHHPGAAPGSPDWKSGILADGQMMRKFGDADWSCTSIRRVAASCLTIRPQRHGIYHLGFKIYHFRSSAKIPEMINARSSNDKC